MAWQDYKLLGFCPDLPITTPGTFFLMRNTVATDRGFGCVPAFAQYSGNGVTFNAFGPTNGGALVSTLAGTQELIVGVPTKLYSYGLGAGVDPVDRSGAAYGATATDAWSVTAFGSIVLAANRNDFLQQRTIGAAANFAAVGAAPVPKANIVITAGPVSAPFVVVFDYDDGGGVLRDGWKCSGLADYTSWTANTATQSATGRLFDGASGPITAAIPYRDGIVAWKRNAMYVGTYTGIDGVTNPIWSWRRVSGDIGCIGKNACSEADDIIYFADEYGVWMFDGSYPRRIVGSVQKYWADRVVALAPTAADKNYYRLVWDKGRHLIWVLPGSGIAGAAGYHLAGMNYNTISGLWSQAIKNGAQTFPLSSALFALDDGTTACWEMLSAEWFVVQTSGNIVVGRMPYGGSAVTTAGSSTVYGWAIADQVTSPVIKGVRPHWSYGISSATAASTWLSGQLLAFGAERDIQPGNISVSPIATVTLQPRNPGKLDGVLSAADVLSFQFTTTAAGLIGWEITGISVDIGSQGKT